MGQLSLFMKPNLVIYPWPEWSSNRGLMLKSSIELQFKSEMPLERKIGCFFEYIKEQQLIRQLQVKHYLGNRGQEFWWIEEQ